MVPIEGATIPGNGRRPGETQVAKPALTGARQKSKTSTTGSCWRGREESQIKYGFAPDGQIPGGA